MPIKVVMPDLQPGWVGGVRYLSTIRAGIDQLEAEGFIEVLRWPKVSFDNDKSRYKFGLRNAVTFSFDAIRSIRGINLPRPMSPFSRKSLAWIPDLQDVERPEFFSNSELIRREKLRKRYLEKRYAFIFSSRNALDVFNSIGYTEPLIAGILRFATNFSIENENAASNLKCEGCREEGFFYLPNQWWVHKNHELALKSFLEYQLSGGKKHLVLTGSEFDSRWRGYSADYLFSKINLRNVHRMGLVDRTLQRELYFGSKAVLQPSRYEGWSTTIEEALSCGTPIIASNIPTNIEQLIDCPDSIVLRANTVNDFVEALHSPPKRLNRSEISFRNAERWQRFIQDLKTVVSVGEYLTGEGKVK